MNSALRISVVIAWLMVTITVSPSHANGPLCATLKPLLATFIGQLPADSVNEITPHVEALASIVKGNDIYHFFHNVEEECHKYQNKLGNTNQSTVNTKNNEEKIEENQKKEGSVSYSVKRPLKEENEVSKKVNETSGKEEAVNKESTDSDAVSSDSEGGLGAKKASIVRNRLTLRGLPEGVPKGLRKNNIEVVLLRQGDKLTVSTRRPNEQQKQQPKVNIAGQAGEKLVRDFVESIIPAA